MSLISRLSFSATTKCSLFSSMHFQCSCHATSGASLSGSHSGPCGCSDSASTLRSWISPIAQITSLVTSHTIRRAAQLITSLWCSHRSVKGESDDDAIKLNNLPMSTTFSNLLSLINFLAITTIITLSHTTTEAVNLAILDTTISARSSLISSPSWAWSTIVRRFRLKWLHVVLLRAAMALTTCRTITPFTTIPSMAMVTKISIQRMRRIWMRWETKFWWKSMKGSVSVTLHEILNSLFDQNQSSEVNVLLKLKVMICALLLDTPDFFIRNSVRQI